MNNYCDDYLDELEEAMDSFDVDSRVIKQFELESKHKKIDRKKKKINKIGDKDE
jgi:hypothetical protein